MEKAIKEILRPFERRRTDVRKERKSHRSIRHRQSQRALGIREQPRPQADKDRSGFFAAQILSFEPHSTARKSLL
jgi:hypothetical protein